MTEEFNSFRETLYIKFNIRLTEEHWSIIKDLFVRIHQDYPHMKLQTFYEKSVCVGMIRLPYFLFHMYEESLDDEVLCPIGVLFRNSKKRGVDHDCGYDHIYKRENCSGFDSHYYEYFCMLCVSDKGNYYLASEEDHMLLKYEGFEGLVDDKYRIIELKSENRNIINSWSIYDVPEESPLDRILRILKEKEIPEQRENQMTRFGDLLK